MNTRGGKHMFLISKVNFIFVYFEIKYREIGNVKVVRYRLHIRKKNDNIRKCPTMFVCAKTFIHIR